MDLIQNVINCIKNLLSLFLSNPLSFILLYKFIFLGYSINIAVALYVTKNLPVSQRFRTVSKTVFLIFAIQMIRLLACHLNSF